ncbi:hypothetical protein FIBSPDRAFT_854388 [Athelia psychrophila]|uniref:Uncharacterized protein n=1 Tax=Athelia psychrophila TaxID=1759441 RepID=A0A166Q3U4_9AGAM|nr:hypothetical protein FIBSPDRAFT_854388 [Fibularhizoctonia sp. CBS 109695]
MASLYLVTGCDKSTTWGIAAVSRDSESSNEIALRFTAAPVFDIGFPGRIIAQRSYELVRISAATNPCHIISVYLSAG